VAERAEDLVGVRLPDLDEFWVLPARWDRNDAELLDWTSFLANSFLLLDSLIGSFSKADPCPMSMHLFAP
jgi:hypothetical protein